MNALLRSIGAALAIAFATVTPAQAFSVGQMKEMEAKVKKVLATNMPAVVALMGDKVPGAGSGVVVSADGLILTAGHVTQGNDTMTVVFPSGKQATFPLASRQAPRSRARLRARPGRPPEPRRPRPAAFRP